MYTNIQSSSSWCRRLESSASRRFVELVMSSRRSPSWSRAVPLLVAPLAAIMRRPCVGWWGGCGERVAFLEILRSSSGQVLAGTADLPSHLTRVTTSGIRPSADPHHRPCNYNCNQNAPRTPYMGRSPVNNQDINLDLAKDQAPWFSIPPQFTPCRTFFG